MGIGTTKSASTWIAKCLDEHPEICVSKPKEPHFFYKDEEYQDGGGVDKYYEKYFNHCDIGSIKGEFSVDYIDYPKVAGRVKKHFPDIKLIISLRNPIDRAYSNYWYFKNIYNILEDTFEEALKNHEGLIRRGFYASNLQEFLKLFPRENFLFVIYEDIKKDSVKFIQQIYKFLEVDENFCPPSVQKKIWVTSHEQYPFIKINKFKINLIKFCKKNFLLKYFIRLLKWAGLENLVQRPFAILAKKGYKEADAKSFQKPPIKSDTRKFLQETYKNEIKNMEKILDRDLSFWK